jgi:hypothetical protein
VIGDIRRKVIAVRECADHRVTLPRHSAVCRHHCGRGRALSVLGQRRFGVVVHFRRFLSVRQVAVAQVYDLRVDRGRRWWSWDGYRRACNERLPDSVSPIATLIE